MTAEGIKDQHFKYKCKIQHGQEQRKQKKRMPDRYCDVMPLALRYRSCKVQLRRRGFDPTSSRLGRERSAIMRFFAQFFFLLFLTARLVSNYCKLIIFVPMTSRLRSAERINAAKEIVAAALIMQQPGRTPRHERDLLKAAEEKAKKWKCSALTIT